MLLFFLIIGALSVRNQSVTYDEPYHYQYGLNVFTGNSTRFDDSKMPFSALNALPAGVARTLPDGFLKENLAKLYPARLMTLLFSMVAGFIVFHWSRKLYGPIPGLISLALYTLDPNLIAHSQLVTTDIYITGMILFCAYSLWKFASTGKTADGVIFAVLLGLAQLAKYTAVSLYLLLPIALLVNQQAQLRLAFSQGLGPIWRETRRYLLYAIIVLAISILVINLGFLFNRSFTNLRDYELKSSLFQAIQAKINLPIPTPYPYLEGFDWISAKESTNLGFIYIYLLGNTRFGQGFPGYYIVASILKVPLATQVIVITALLVYFSDRQRRKSFFKNEWFLLWLVFFYTIYFNFFYKSQIGIRYYLLVFPLLYVFVGSLFTNWNKFTRAQGITSLALGIFLLGSVFSKYPNYLSYFNELIGDQKNAYKYLADSNLEWGQDTHLLEQYRKDHPRAKKAPETPGIITEKTTYYVSINRLVGAINGPENYRWLRENFEPADLLGNSFLIYKISPAEIRKLCETSTYCK